MKTIKTGFLALLAVVALLFAGATMVQAAEEADGVGDALIYPLYLAIDAAYTEFTLVNTASTDQAVHIQVRSQGDSQDQTDFCIDMTKKDVYKAKISASGNGAILETLNNVDYLDPSGDPRPNWSKAEDTYNLTESDTSDCAYGTQKGYIVAYAVASCKDYTLVDNAELMGNTRVIETATSKIMALNAVAIEATAGNFALTQAALNKDELYMIWEYEKCAAVLTVPTMGTLDPVNQGMDLVGADDDGKIDNELEGCGLAQLDNDFEHMYNLDEKEFSHQSPHYYPANEVSIVNFADAGSNTDATNFFINGGAVNWGLNFTSATLEEGWTAWEIPTTAANGDDLSPLHNVVCSYFISTNNSLAWMPCQYSVPAGP
jgi:hypothetical protein